MDQLELKIFVLGELYTNSYLVFNPKTKNAFIVDLPSGPANLKKFIHQENLNILFVILTHAHFDHMAGLAEFSCPFYVHKSDMPLLSDERLNCSIFLDMPFTIKREALFLSEEQALPFESRSIDVIHTPGHTPGSVSFKFGDWLFSGDTLFFDSIGRTDIPLSSSDLILQSIHQKILTLSSDMVVYPGHGRSTTIGREKKMNYFLQK